MTAYHKAKMYVYRAGQALLRTMWRAGGGRRIKAFGQKLRLAPQTAFPSYRRLRLPREGAKSEIVRYADYVQLHSIMDYVASLGHAATIVEVGAHHGAYAVLLGKAVKKLGGRVIAVEPNPLCFDVLLRNVSCNELAGVVSCENCAIMDKPGKVNITLDDSESRVAGAVSAGSVAVEAITLQMLLEKHRIATVDLLLVDVEGAELPALRGFPWGKAALGKIFCEFHPYAWADFGYSGTDMGAFLQIHGLRCVDMYLKEYTAFPGQEYIGPTVLFAQGANASAIP